MLHRLLIAAAGLVAGTLVATPAVLGLSGNSSFSRDIQVPVPSGAHQVHFVDPQRSDDGPRHDVGDNHGVRRTGSDDGVRHDVGDDHGGRRTGSDDGVRHDVGDDHGGSDGDSDGGSDDGGSHGGRGRG